MLMIFAFAFRTFVYTYRVYWIDDWRPATAQCGPVVFWALRPEKISEFTFIEPIKWKSFILSHALAHSAHASAASLMVARLLIAYSQTPNSGTFLACKSEETTVIITIVMWIRTYIFEIVGKHLIILFLLFFFVWLSFRWWLALFALRSNYKRDDCDEWSSRFRESTQTHTQPSLPQPLHWMAHMVVLCQWLDQRLIISAMWSVSCCKAIHFISNLFDFICVECVCVRRRLDVCVCGHWRRLPQTPYLLPYSDSVHM